MSTESTLLLIKPDGVRRGLVGYILSRIEQSGLRFCALQLRWSTEAEARGHYPSHDTQLLQMGLKLINAVSSCSDSLIGRFGTDNPRRLGMEIFERNVRFLLSGPIVVCIVEGPNAMLKVRALCGATMPSDASPASVRGIFSSVGAEQILTTEGTVENLVHSSDPDFESVSREIHNWFPDWDAFR